MKKSIRKVFISALCLFLCLASLTGCASKKTGESNKPFELTIVSSNNTHGITLDPAIDYCGSRNGVIGVAETLFILDNETLELQGFLAKDYQQVDANTWVINIRDDVNFSNGNKLTAEAVKKSIEYTLAGIDRLATLLNVKSIEADSQTLTIKTNSTVAILPRILTDAGMIIFDTEGTDNYEKGVIGTGPYILESMDDEGNCELVRNDKYWQETPAAEKIHTKFIADNDAITTALQSGELDYANVPVSGVSLFENNADYQVTPYDTGRVYFLYINPGYTFTQDAALREALQYAFDRESYVDGIYDGRGKATTTIFPEWSGYSDTSVAAQPEYNIETAKKILQDTGYVDTNNDGFLEKDGKKVTLAITCYPNNSFKELSEAIQASLKEIGIDSQITVSESIVADLQEGNYNLGTYGYTTLNLGDCYNFLEPVFHTDASSNFIKFSDTKVDELINQLSAEPDTTKRKQLAIEMQKNIFESNNYVFLLHINSYTVARADLKNVETGIGNSFYLWKVTK
ncbi:MAG: ABC transporter substrate-binding protein [Paludibacter sp.]|jgi:peptide/nickel transport system substrate-binding protein|nr:ABC transporter substrate-binding protein [Paludibacter sp.]